MKRLRAALLLSLASAACRGGDSDLPPRYRRLEVPEERLHAPAARERGRRLFLAHCALCHGEGGDGHGMRSAGFAKPPADFTDLAWRRRSSPRRVFFAIREGLRGTPMPSWAALSDEEAWDLAAYVLSLGEPPPSGSLLGERKRGEAQAEASPGGLAQEGSSYDSSEMSHLEDGPNGPSKSPF